MIFGNLKKGDIFLKVAADFNDEAIAQSMAKIGGCFAGLSQRSEKNIY